MTSAATLETTRARIAEGVRTLRGERGWTQARLAKEIDLSQSRLSEIERGAGSFSAEQLLALLAIFNVGPERFAAPAPDGRHGGVQNALARFGASHLRQVDGLGPGEGPRDPAAAIQEALVSGSARLITALAPVLVANADGLGLHAAQLGLARAGFERRLPWLVANTLAALADEASRPSTARNDARARVVLETFLDAVAPLASKGAKALDVLDATIRSRATLDEVKQAGSAISHRWGVVTRLQPADFREALGAARGDP